MKTFTSLAAGLLKDRKVSDAESVLEVTEEMLRDTG